MNESFLFAPRFAGEAGVAEEVAELLARSPELSKVVARPETEASAKPIVLARGCPSFFVLPIEVEEVPGRLFVGRLPGRAPHAERDVAALFEFGIRAIFCVVPEKALRELHGASAYLEAAQKVFERAFWLLSVRDHDIPDEDENFERAVDRLLERLTRGESVYVHCVGGCGRTGMLVASLLVRLGHEPLEAVRAFQRARMCGPETPEQVAYVVRYGRRLARRRPSARGASGERLLESECKVARLTVVCDHEGQPRELTRGGLAKIAIGRLKWPGCKARRVAVKLFNYPVDDADARNMATCIEALKNARVALPKMGLVRYRQRWVLVSPLFGSWEKGSKLSQPTDLIAKMTYSQQTFAIQQLTRVALAGYRPSSDLFLLLGGRDGSLVPLDLDLVVREESDDARARELMKRVIQIGNDRDRREVLTRWVEVNCKEWNEAGDALWEAFLRLRAPESPFARLFDSL